MIITNIIIIIVIIAIYHYAFVGLSDLAKQLY
jgi:hypothetical protein